MVPLTLDNLDDLPGRCRRCVSWELPEHLGEQAAEFGDTEFEKEAWVSGVMLDWGSCGQIVYVDGVPAGFALYAPPDGGAARRRLPDLPGQRRRGAADDART